MRDKVASFTFWQQQWTKYFQSFKLFCLYSLVHAISRNEALTDLIDMYIFSLAHTVESQHESNESGAIICSHEQQGCLL